CTPRVSITLRGSSLLANTDSGTTTSILDGRVKSLFRPLLTSANSCWSHSMGCKVSSAGLGTSLAARPVAGGGAVHLPDRRADPGGEAVLDVAGPALGRQPVLGDAGPLVAPLDPDAPRGDVGHQVVRIRGDPGPLAVLRLEAQGVIDHHLPRQGDPQLPAPQP